MANPYVKIPASIAESKSCPLRGIIKNRNGYFAKSDNNLRKAFYEIYHELGEQLAQAPHNLLHDKLSFAQYKKLNEDFEIIQSEIQKLRLLKNTLSFFSFYSE